MYVWLLALVLFIIALIRSWNFKIVPFFAACQTWCERMCKDYGMSLWKQCSRSAGQMEVAGLLHWPCFFSFLALTWWRCYENLIAPPTSLPESKMVNSESSISMQLKWCNFIEVEMNLYFTFPIHFNEVGTTFLFLFGNVWSLSRIVLMFDHLCKMYLIFTGSELVTCTTMSSQLTCKYKNIVTMELLLYISISILMKNRLMKPFSHKSNPLLSFKSCFLQFRSLHDQFLLWYLGWAQF